MTDVTTLRYNHHGQKANQSQMLKAFSMRSIHDNDILSKFKVMQ